MWACPCCLRLGSGIGSGWDLHPETDKAVKKLQPSSHTVAEAPAEALLYYVFCE